MKKLLKKIKISGRKGQTTTEYVIILGLVALGSIAVILLFGNQVRELFGAATGRLAGRDDVTIEDHSDDDAVDMDFQDAFEGY